MIRLLLVILSIGIAFSCSGQTVKQSLISTYLKTGAYNHDRGDVFSFSANQANLASISSFSAGVFSERRFMLNELSLFSAAVGLPTTSGNFGLQLHRFGNTSYNEMQAGLAYGRKLNDFVDLGVQFNYYTLNVAGYGKAGTVNFDAAAIFHFTDQLHGGIHVYNPVSSKFGKSKEERLPAVYNAGIGFNASENFFVSAEIEKIEDRPISVNANMQYKFADRFLARGGIVSATSVWFFGAGFIFKNYRVDAIASVHPQLGVSPGLLLIYTKPAKE